MMTDKDDKPIEAFQKERGVLQDKMTDHANLEMKRFLALDSQVYQDGALPAVTKELLGLVSSLVLRCEDCIQYHLLRCFGLGVTTEQLTEALNIGLIVGGSITIPHIRRAFRDWDDLSARGVNNSI